MQMSFELQRLDDISNLC